MGDTGVDGLGECGSGGQEDFSEEVAFELCFVCSSTVGEGEGDMDGGGESFGGEQGCDLFVCCGEGIGRAAHEHDATDGRVSSHEVTWEDVGWAAASDDEDGPVLSDEAKVGSEVFLGGGFDEDVGAETVGDVEDVLFDGGGIGGGVDDAIGAEEAAEGGSGGGATGDGDGVGACMEGELDCGEPDASACAADEDGLLGFEGGVVEEGDCGGGVGDAEGGAGFEGGGFGKREELGGFAKSVLCVSSGDTSCEVDTITDLVIGGWGG